MFRLIRSSLRRFLWRISRSHFRFVVFFFILSLFWVFRFACHGIENNGLRHFVRLAKIMKIDFWITSFGQRMKILWRLEVWWKILNRLPIDWEFGWWIRCELNRFSIDQDIREFAQSRGEPNRFPIDQQIRATREYLNRFSIDQQIREATREHLNRFSIDQQSEQNQRPDESILNRLGRDRSADFKWWSDPNRWFL